MYREVFTLEFGFFKLPSLNNKKNCFLADVRKVFLSTKLVSKKELIKKSILCFYSDKMYLLSTKTNYLIGQKNVGLIFRLTKLFVRDKIFVTIVHESFFPKFVFVTHYVYKCLGIKHLGKNLIYWK